MKTADLYEGANVPTPEKTVLVIGNSKGNIGEAIAKRFLGDFGFRVVTADINQDADIYVDITDEGSVQKMMAYMRSAYGHLDVVVNAAGVNWMNKMDNLPLDEFKQVLDINLTANFIVLKAYDEEFGDSDTKKVFLSVTSDSGIIPKSNSTSYCSSKAGANHFMCTAAREISKKGKNWIVIPMALGRVQGTPMDAQTTKDMTTNMGLTLEEAQALLNKNIPLGRGMMLEEVGEWAYFLATKGDYAHGCIMRIDAGQLQG